MEVGKNQKIRKKHWDLDLARTLDTAAEAVAGRAWRARKAGRFCTALTLERPYIDYDWEKFLKRTDGEIEIPHSSDFVEFGGNFFHNYVDGVYDPYAEFFVSNNLQDVIQLDEIPPEIHQSAEDTLQDDYSRSLDDFVIDGATFARRVSVDFQIKAEPTDSDNQRLVVTEMDSSIGITYLIHHIDFHDEDHDYISDQPCRYFQHSEYDSTDQRANYEETPDSYIKHTLLAINHETLDPAEKILIDNEYESMTRWLQYETLAGVHRAEQARRVVAILQKFPMLRR